MSRIAWRQRLRSANARKGLIGLVLPDIQNPFYVEVIRGVEAYAYQHGFAVMIGNFGQDEERQKLYFDIFKSEAVDGLIVAPAQGRDQHIIEAIEAGFNVVMHRPRPERDRRRCGQGKQSPRRVQTRSSI